MMRKFYALLAISFIGIAPAIHAMDKPKTTSRIVEALKPNKGLVKKLANDISLANMMALECSPNDLYAQMIIGQALALANDNATMKNGCP